MARTRTEGSTEVRGIRISWTAEGGPLSPCGRGRLGDRWSIEESGTVDGAAEADLPPRDAARGRPAPAPILSSRGDPARPVSTAHARHGLIPGSGTPVARSLADVRDWGERAARSVAVGAA